MTMLDTAALEAALGGLDEIDENLSQAYPGTPFGRRPVHTVYGGAQLFKANLASRIGYSARQHMRTYFPDFVTLAEVLELEGWDGLPPATDPRLARIVELEQDILTVRPENMGIFLGATVYRRTYEKLEQEPVEDFRIDFEDGFGPRPDGEEDEEALRTADEVAKGIEEQTLPPFIGIRIKSLGASTRERSVRTLNLFLGRLLEKSGGLLPEGFVVTLPKIDHPAQVTALVRLFEALERTLGLRQGSLRMELMVETPPSIYGPDGRLALPAMVAAAEGRCVGAHLGVYDYTAACSIIAAHQGMEHPACDHARQIMQVALAGTGVVLSDGATNTMPIGPFRQSNGGPPLTDREEAENRYLVHRVSKLNYANIRHSLRLGIYQGWDLHPSQLPIRYAAVYAFFLQNLKDMTLRLRTFVDRSAQATLLGEVFDDAATGQALLEFFLRGLGCGAITEDEATATGLTLEEIGTRSFQKILDDRRRRYREDMGEA